MHGGGVVLPEPARVSHIVIAFAEREQRRRAAKLRGKGFDDGDVFLVDVDLHRRRKVIALGHQRAAHLEHARRSGAVLDDPIHQVGIDPCPLGQHESFGSRQIVYGDQQIGDELQLGAGAERATVVRIARKTRKDLLAARAGAARAPARAACGT